MSCPYPLYPRLIAHRGNWKGVNEELENSPDYLQKALDIGYYVETDLWYLGEKKWALGHDKPQYPIDESFLRTPKIYFHAKTIQTFYQLVEHYPYLNCFFHQNDDVTLTTDKEIWTYPGKELTKRSIIVLRPGEPFPTECVFGICADDFRELLTRE